MAQPPSLILLATSSPLRPVASTASTPYQHTMDEKSLTQLSDEKRSAQVPFSSPSSSSSVGPSRYYNSSPLAVPSPPSRPPSPFLRGPSPLLIPSHRAFGQTHPYTRLRGLRISNHIKPWIPLILYGITSVGFLVAVAFWKNEVFEGESFLGSGTAL